MEALLQTLNLGRDLFRFIRWADLVDILIVSFIIYRLLLLIRGTRAVQMLLGLAFLTLVFWLSAKFEIRTLRALLSLLFDNLFIILILIFQQEIRRALSQVGRTPFLRALTGAKDGQAIEELVKSAVSLANKKIGALIVIENRANVLDFIEPGTTLDSQLERDILVSIFMPVSPLHDGAVIIRKGRIFMAGCFLPLSLNPSVSKAVGTRHRAAVGLTEETDAVCLVVSEENGGISLASKGKILHNLDQGQLRKSLLDAFKGLT